MFTFRWWMKEVDEVQNRAKREYERTLERAACLKEWLKANITTEAMLGVEVDMGYWSSDIILKAAMPKDARRVMKYFGGKFDKKWNETSGKFDFIRTEKVDGKGIIIRVNAGKSCKIREIEVTETNTYKVKKFVLDGDCGSILEDRK